MSQSFWVPDSQGISQENINGYTVYCISKMDILDGFGQTVTEDICRTLRKVFLLYQEDIGRKWGNTFLLLVTNNSR